MRTHEEMDALLTEHEQAIAHHSEEIKALNNHQLAHHHGLQCALEQSQNALRIAADALAVVSHLLANANNDASGKQQ